MKTFEVVINKPTKVQDWCIYDNKTIYVDKPTTVAIISAFNQERLMVKLDKLYNGFKVLSIKEI